MGFVSKPIVQIARNGVAFFGSGRDLARLRQEYDRHHWVRLPQFLESELLRLVQRWIARSRFREKIHLQGGSRDLCIDEDPLLGMLHFLLNHPKLFELVQQITGCVRIGRVRGRYQRMLPGHYDSWHDDVDRHLLAVISINLSTGIYRGGVLQIREKRSKRILTEVANTGFGDALVLRIAKGLEHQVSGVEGPVARTVFAGVFRSRPSYARSLKERVSQLKKKR